MIGDITRWIMEMLQAHGPVVVFWGVIIESIIVPIPSPLIIMGAGALLIEPGLTWPGAFGPIALRIVLPSPARSLRLQPLHLECILGPEMATDA